MRRAALVVAAIFSLGLGGHVRSGAELSGPVDQDGGAVCAGLAGRRAGERCSRRARRAPRPERDRREQAGRRHHLGHQGSDRPPLPTAIRCSWPARRSLTSALLYPDLGFDPLDSIHARSRRLRAGRTCWWWTRSCRSIRWPNWSAHAKANPGKLTFGFGLGTAPQIVGDYFKAVAGLDITRRSRIAAASRCASIFWEAASTSILRRSPTSSG